MLFCSGSNVQASFRMGIFIIFLIILQMIVLIVNLSIFSAYFFSLTFMNAILVFGSYMENEHTIMVWMNWALLQAFGLFNLSVYMGWCLIVMPKYKEHVTELQSQYFYKHSGCIQLLKKVFTKMLIKDFFQNSNFRHVFQKSIIKKIFRGMKVSYIRFFVF